MSINIIPMPVWSVGCGISNPIDEFVQNTLKLSRIIEIFPIQCKIDFKDFYICSPN
ncbi:MAG: hypothetical protein LBJ00_06720 [Planctomycetaceae bacterium]|nr:hypothetical protein [Planctomycetaceae bacterium]